MADRPVLAVIPLPARLDVAAAVIGAVSEVWLREHGQTLTTADMRTESTPWGTTTVIRKPEPARVERPEVDGG
ncbi:hypothetical protein [Herbidospora mongoliensis]|uniref:hypothetical protein n=1 Tax=Herbidospora mongoliensis TaxID=688067 RepID=UPI00083799AA|nr:hypothetical protein [Herbidospora mongoliensis]